ncbi:MAG: PDZ domain-containing protein [Gemmatimonadota bacterium]
MSGGTVRTALALVALGVAASGAAARLAGQQAVVREPGATAGSGWLGVNLNLISTVEDGRSVSTRILIEDVVDGTGAARAGLQAGDLVVGINGAPASQERLIDAIGSLRVGDRVILDVERAGQRVRSSVTAGARPSTLPRIADEPRRADEERQVFVVLSEGARPATWRALRGVPPAEPRTPTTEPRMVRVRGSEGRAVTVMLQFEEDGSGPTTWTWAGTDGPHVRVLRTPDVEALVSDIDLLRQQLDDMTGLHANPQDEAVSFWRLLRGRWFALPRGPELEPEIERARARLQEMEQELATRAMERLGPLPDSVVTVAVPGQRPITPYAYLGRRYLAGAYLVPLNPGLQEYFGVRQGALVLDAVEGAPAAEAGLRPGDVIVEVGGRAVSDPDGLGGVLAGSRPPYPLTVVRQGRRVDLVLP